MATEASGLFHVLAKPSGAQCNLDCAYCFYLDKEKLYPGSRMRMSDAVVDAWLRQIVDAFRDAPVVPVAWQGGEPTLMGLDFYRRATAHLATLLRPGQRAEQSIQTNGLLLDERWVEFLREERFLVGLSIDGPAEVHDRWRVDKGGGPTHARVVRAARLLLGGGVDTNAMVCVHRANQDRALDVYRHLVDELGFRHIQLIPVVEPGPPISEHTVEPAGWGRFLNATFDRWVREHVGQVYFPTFEAALAAWLGIEPAMCVFRETCGDAVALEHNGDVYACDHYVEPSHRLGNVLESRLADLVGSPAQRAFGAKKAELPAQCQRCDVRFACRGECPKNRILRTVDGEEGLNWLCEGFLAFFHHIDRPMKLMAGMLRQGLPPANIMALLPALERGGLGRHDPCPCGSGRKFRKCHGVASEGGA